MQRADSRSFAGFFGRCFRFRWIILLIMILALLATGFHRGTEAQKPASKPDPLLLSLDPL